MSDRKQPRIALLTPQVRCFAGTRWLELAGRIARRYRKRRYWIGLAMHWPRQFARVRWLREHFLQPKQWQLNLGLNIDVHDSRPAAEPRIGLMPVANPVAMHLWAASQAQGPKSGHPWPGSFLVMQRFVAPHTSAVLPQMRTLAGREVHVSVRPVVREKQRADDRLFSRPAAEPAPRPEAARPERFAFPVQNTSTPAAVPIRATDVNVSQIADQVMRLMDHRFSAWRERRGRS